MNVLVYNTKYFQIQLKCHFTTHYHPSNPSSWRFEPSVCDFDESILCGCDMTHPCVTWLIHVWHDPSMCDMTLPCVTWLFHVWRDFSMCDMTLPCVTWIIHAWHIYLRHDLCMPCMGVATFICVTWIIHMCDMTYSYVWHDLFNSATWLMQTHPYVWHYSMIRGITQAYVRNDAKSTHMCDMTHPHVC